MKAFPVLVLCCQYLATASYRIRQDFQCSRIFETFYSIEDLKRPKCLVTEHRNSTITVTITLDLSNCSKNVKYEIRKKWQEAGFSWLSLNMFIFNYALQPFKAYCAIWVRRSNFRHQASPRVLPRESTQRRKVKLWARNVLGFCLNADTQVIFMDLLHGVKLRHGTDGFISPLKEGVLRIFFALKIRRLWPGANPRTWVPKASTLPLDHRSRKVE
jgi:hypothetical protein